MSGATRSGHLPFQGGNVWPIDDGGALGVKWSDRTIADEATFQDVLKNGLAGATDHAVQLTSVVGSRDVASGKKRLLVGDCRHQRVGINDVASNVRVIRDIDIQATNVLCELHGGAVEAMNDHGGFRGGVHSDPTHLSNVGEGQDVGNRGLVEPHRAQIWKIADELGVLKTTVGDGTKDAVARTDVCQQIGVAKNGDR